MRAEVSMISPSQSEPHIHELHLTNFMTNTTWSDPNPTKAMIQLAFSLGLPDPMVFLG